MDSGSIVVPHPVERIEQRVFGYDLGARWCRKEILPLTGELLQCLQHRYGLGCEGEQDEAA
jgi:hypothetical protein